MPDLKLLWEIQALDDRKRDLENKLERAREEEELKPLKADIEEGGALFNQIKKEYNDIKKKSEGQRDGC